MLVAAHNMLQNFVVKPGSVCFHKQCAVIDCPKLGQTLITIASERPLTRIDTIRDPFALIAACYRFLP